MPALPAWQSSRRRPGGRWEMDSFDLQPLGRTPSAGYKSLQTSGSRLLRVPEWTQLHLLPSRQPRNADSSGQPGSACGGRELTHGRPSAVLPPWKHPVGADGSDPGAECLLVLSIRWLTQEAGTVCSWVRSRNGRWHLLSSRGLCYRVTVRCLSMIQLVCRGRGGD